jgi:hypothetical protein
MNRSRPVIPLVWLVLGPLLGAGSLPARAVEPPSAVWTAAAQSSTSTARIALLEEAYRTSRNDPARAASWIGELLDGGFSQRGLDAWRSLPEALRAAPEIRDLHAGLALAAMITGDSQTAERLIQGLPRLAGPLEHQDKRLPRVRGEAELRMVERWLGPDDGDPFDLLTELVVPIQAWPPGMLLGIARLAEHEQQPSVARYALTYATFGGLTYQPGPLPPKAPERVRATLAALEEERIDLLAELRTQAGRDSPEIPALRPSFAELPLPAGISPVERAEDLPATRRAAILSALPSIPWFLPVRAERNGNQVTMIASSNRLDPNYEKGGYWVLLSDDGGRTWPTRLYTGLAVGGPYVVRSLSALPLREGDLLRLEVEVLDKDRRLPTVPGPLGPPPGVIRHGVLEIPLADLRRDTDGDGLTDLAEHRLLLDPADRDTDHDTIGDAEDVLPNLFPALLPTPEAFAVKALFADVVSEREAEIPGQVRFLVGDRPLFAALEPGQRTIVLTPGEALVMQNENGHLRATWLSLFMMDRTGRRALAVWSMIAEGGTELLEEHAGVWKIENRWDWIS